MGAFLKPLSVFLERERSQQSRYQFDGIQPVARTGGSVAHARAITRLTTARGNRLLPPCEPLVRN